MSKRRPEAQGPAFPRPEAKRVTARLLRAHRAGLVDLGKEREEKLAHILSFGYMTPPESRFVTAIWRDYGKQVAAAESWDGEKRTATVAAMDDALNATVGAPPTTR